MIYLEESIRFDGHTDQFPDLTSLAGLRGIEPVHGHKSHASKTSVLEASDIDDPVKEEE